MKWFAPIDLQQVERFIVECTRYYGSQQHKGMQKRFSLKSNRKVNARRTFLFEGFRVIANSSFQKHRRGVGRGITL